MTVETEEQLEALRRVGRIVALTLREMRSLVEPGMTTEELNRAGAAILQRHGVSAAPPRVYGFPGDFCISMNDEAAHGIPAARPMQPGDLVKIDLTAELDGYMADAALTVAVPPLRPRLKSLMGCAQSALQEAVGAARSGRRLNEVGRAAELVVKRQGFAVVRGLCGHGVGRTIHEDPRYIPSYFDPRASERLKEGIVLALEPHITTGKGDIETLPDGWTIRTVDRSPVANFEHTVVVTRGKPIVVTAA